MENKRFSISNKMEQRNQRIINFNKYWIAKIDAKKITLNKNHLFDEALSNIFVKISGNLMKEFRPHLIYTYNLSIYLFFGTTEDRKSINANEFISMICSYASIKFNEYLRNLPKEPLYPLERIYFGGSIFELKSPEEQFNYLYWTISTGSIEYSINRISEIHFSKKMLKGKDSFEKVRMLNEKGIEWNKASDPFKFGILIKRKLIPSKISVRNKKGQIREENIMKNEIYYRSMNIAGFDENLMKMLFSKILGDTTDWLHLGK